MAPRFSSITLFSVGLGISALSACGQTLTPPPVLPSAPTAEVAIPVAGPPAGRLRGTVTDAGSGAPLEGVRIVVLSPLITEPRFTATDSAGQYEVGVLPVGTFSVSASRVSRAADVSDIEFVVRRVPWSRILGEAKRTDNSPLRFAAIVMQPNDPERLSPGQRLGAKWLPDGRFSFEQVPPGDYIIRALGEIDTDAPMLFAALPLTVEGRDTAGIVLTLTRGATLSGRVRFQSHGTPGPDVTQLRLYAPLIDGTRFGGEPRGRIQSNGRFQLVGVDAGRRLIRASQIPAPWSLERVVQRGRDITDIPIDVQQGQKLQDVELIFTDTAPSVAGTVRSASDRPIVDGLVVVFPVDRSLWRPASRHIRSARTDWQGHYDIGPLPPGEYLIASAGDFEEADIFERETLDQISPKAIPVTLSAGQKRRQDVRDDAPGGTSLGSTRASGVSWSLAYLSTWNGSMGVPCHQCFASVSLKMAKCRCGVLFGALPVTPT